jgi:hypothetical protein
VKDLETKPFGDRIEERTAFEDRIEKSLQALERYVCSVDPYTLIMSYASAVVPEIVRAFIWHRTSDCNYDLVYELPALDRTTAEELARSTTWSKNRKPRNKMNFDTGVSRRAAVIKTPIQTERESRSARFAVLVPYAPNPTLDLPIPNTEDAYYEYIAEIYFDGGGLVDADKLENEIAPKVEALLLRIYPRINEIIAIYKEDDKPLEWGRIFEAALFDIVSKASPPPVNALPGASHMFIYEGRDRLLYHWATNNMGISRDQLPNYKPPAQTQDPDLIEFVNANIDGLNGVSRETKRDLKEMLLHLKDRAWVQENAEQKLKLLLHLLSLLPQEPGTGVAGYAAFTQIPQISNRDNEALWNPDTYDAPAFWFPTMLSIEKLFSVATSGREMFAVPMHEAGQLAGVFFVIPSRRPFDQPSNPPEQEMFENTLDLIEMAAREAPVMTMYRTLMFHQAVITSVYRDRQSEIAALIAEHAPLAFNTPLTAYCRVKADGTFTVTTWGIRRPHERYRRLGNFGQGNDIFHSPQLAEKVRGLKNIDATVCVLKRPASGAEDDWGMPPGYVEAIEKDLGIELKAALLVRPPSSDDAVVIYLESSSEVLINNLPLIQRKLGVMQIAEEQESARAPGNQQSQQRAGRLVGRP